MSAGVQARNQAVTTVLWTPDGRRCLSGSASGEFTVCPCLACAPAPVDSAQGGCMHVPGAAPRGGCVLCGTRVWAHVYPTVRQQVWDGRNFTLDTTMQVRGAAGRRRRRRRCAGRQVHLQTVGVRVTVHCHQLQMPAARHDMDMIHPHTVPPQCHLHIHPAVSGEGRMR